MDGAKIELDDELAYQAETVSTAFDIHQMDALQIVLAGKISRASALLQSSGEIQAEHFASIPRGLLAVACYYDYHRFLALTLQVWVLFIEYTNILGDIATRLGNRP